MCVLTAVFSTIFRFGNIENYPLYLILGNTLFALMADSTSGAMNSIIDSASLIKKIKINKIIFPIEKVLFQLVNFAISLIAVIIVMVFFRIAPTPNLLLLPVLLVYMFFFCSGLGLVLSSLVVFFRDVQHLWGVLLTAWTYATPIFYPIEILPEWLLALEQYNPMYHFVHYYREIALWGTTPSLEANLLCIAFAVITFAVGFIVFRKTQKKFILYV